MRGVCSQAPLHTQEASNRACVNILLIIKGPSHSCMTTPTCRVAPYRMSHTCPMCASDGFCECFCLVSALRWNAGISVLDLEWAAILVMVNCAHWLASLYHFIIDCAKGCLFQIEAGVSSKFIHSNGVRSWLLGDSMHSASIVCMGSECESERVCVYYKLMCAVMVCIWVSK